MPTIVTDRYRRCTGDLPRLILAVAARTVLLTVLLLALWSTVPAFLGWHVTTVVSDSMAPAIRTGDVVAAMPSDADDVTPGRVLLVEDPDHDDRLRLHRVHRVEPDGSLRLRGDANPAADRTAVDPDAVLGIGVLRFPGVGLPSVWLRAGDWPALATTAEVLVLLVLLGRADRDLRTGVPCRRCGAPRWDLRNEVDAARTELSVSAVALPAMAAVALVAMAASTAGAGFSGSTDARSTLGSTPTFPCFHHDAAEAALAWDFAEKGGRSVMDSSGHGRDGLLGAGADRIDGSCGDNPYVSFTTATTDSVVHSTAAVTAPDEFAIEVWYRTDRAQGRLFGFTGTPTGTTGAYDRNFYVGSDGRLVFGVWDTSIAKVVQSPNRIDDASWHHAVGQFRAGQLELYLDGTLVASRTDVATAVSYRGFWRAGHGQIEQTWPNAPSNSAFVGSIDSVRVHHGLLTSAQIAARFTAGR
jgi:hypothetical protein